MPCVIKPVAGSFVEAQNASTGTTRRKRSITSPSSASPSNRPAQQSLFTSEKVRSSRTTSSIVPPDTSCVHYASCGNLLFNFRMSNHFRSAQIRKTNMTDSRHIQSPVRDLQFHFVGSVLERRRKG